MEKVWSVVQGIPRPTLDDTFDIYRKLNLEIQPNSTISNKLTSHDLLHGVEFYYYLTHQTYETDRLRFFFINIIISNESPGTIFQATINTLKPRVIRDKTNFEMVKLFYQKLEDIFDLQLGKILIALSTRDELEEMIMNMDPPYFVKYKEEILECIKHNCTRIYDLLKNFGKLTINNIFESSSAITFQTQRR